MDDRPQYGKKVHSRTAFILFTITCVLGPSVFLLVLGGLFLLESWLLQSMILGPTCNLFDQSECFSKDALTFSEGKTSGIHLIKLDDSSRELSEEEIFSISISKSIIYRDLEIPRKKVAFMFLTRGPLPLERLWMRFFDVIYKSVTFLKS